MVDADIRGIGRERFIVRWIKEKEMLFHLFVEERAWLIVQVAHQEERFIPLVSLSHNHRNACHAVFFCQAEVCASYYIVLELCYNNARGGERDVR